jgi:hypothetical protein
MRKANSSLKNTLQATTFRNQDFTPKPNPKAKRINTLHTNGWRGEWVRQCVKNYLVGEVLNGEVGEVGEAGEFGDDGELGAFGL